MTATVETVAEQLDLAAIMPTEKIPSAVARSVTLSEADVGMNLHFFFFLIPQTCDINYYIVQYT